MLVKVVINNSINCNPLLNFKSAFLSFNYDEALISYIKELRYRFYDATNKTWEIQYSDLTALCKFFGSKGYTFDIIDKYVEPNKEEDYSKTIPENYKFVLQPLEYQREGILYGLNHPKFLLADQMGLGKTLQSIYISDICSKEKVLVIVCSASLKYNWKNEIENTLGRKDAYVLGTITKTKKDGTTSEKEGNGKDKLADLENIDNIKEKYIITNRETITLLNEKKGRSKIFPIANKINELCEQGKIGAILVDECHLGLKDPTNLSSKALLKINSNKPIKIAITGTPVLNAPLDVFVVLKWLNALNEKTDFWVFKNTFANLDMWGKPVSYKNIPQLSALLKSHMLRREKADNLPDLPEKTYVEDYIEMTTKQKNLYKVINRGLRNEIHVMTHSAEPLAKLIDLRKTTGCPNIIDKSLTDDDNAKLKRLKELVQEIVSNGDKVVIYSNWTTTTNLIKDALSIYNPAYITGEVDDKKRIEQMDKLQNDPTCKVLIGNSAMGQGLNMTKASYLIFYDEPWTMGAREQIADRIHRIGQTKNATIITLICKNTIDEGIHQIIEKKGRMSAFVVGDTLDRTSNLKLLKELLSFGA